MVLLILQRELVERWRDGRLKWAGAAILMLMVISLVVGFQHRQEARAEQAVAQDSAYKAWVNQGRRHPHDAAHEGMHAFRPEAALAIADPGINPYIGSTVWLQAHRQSEVMFRPAQDATGLQRFGDLSMAWALQVLAPLLVIALGFNAFSGEREAGLLRQTLSLGVSPVRLLAGKATALAASVLLVLLPAALLGLGASLWVAEAGSRLDVLIRFMLMASGYLLYLSTFVLLTLGVSASSRSSRTAITVMLAIWIVNVVVAPRAMSEIARHVYPSPTRLAFNEALNADLKRTSDRVWMQHFGTTERWGHDVPLNKWGIALKLDDEAKYPVYDRHFGELWDTWQRQQTAQAWSGVVLPILSVRAFSMSMAGTDFAHHRAFTTSAEHYRRLIQDMVSDDLVAHADTQHDIHFSYKADPAFWKKAPVFEHRPPAVEWAFAQGWQGLAALTIAIVLAAGFAVRAVVHQRAY